MKEFKRITAVLLAVLSISCIFGCSQEPEKVSEPESSVVSVEESSEPSQESKKEESSKPKPESKVESSIDEMQYPQEVDSTREILSDFSSLVSQNPDTVGWINVPNTPINYVVLQHTKDLVDAAYGKDPYYLNKDFNENYLYAGSIFLDYRSPLDAKNLMLHGHSMANGTQFASILHFSQLGVYKSTPVISFNSIYEKSKWKIIAVIKVNTLEIHGKPFNYLRSSFGSDYDFLNYVYQLRLRSIIDCPVDVNEDDQIITLSTCAYDFNKFRMAIIARKVRPGENSKVDVSKAKLNPNPLYPDVWYTYYGGTKPKETSFQTELNNGKLKWYDGEKKFTSKDDEKLKKMISDGIANAEKRIRASYKESDYSAEQIASINHIISVYMPVIKKCTNMAEINDMCRQAMAVIAQYSPENKASEEDNKEKQRQLKLARSSAVKEIKETAAQNTYSKTDQKQVDSIIKEYTKKINACNELNEIYELKYKAVAEIKAIKTQSG